MRVKPGTVVTVKALPEELVALSPGHEIEMYEVGTLSLEVVKVVRDVIFVLHQPL